jgi:hypothetical protein
MRVVTGHDQLVAQYCAQRIGIDVTRNTPFVGLAVKNSSDEFVAGIIISNYRGTDCEITMAAETANWARKGIMAYVFEYIFNQLGCVRCTCIVKNGTRSKRKNATPEQRTRRFLEGIGFVLEGNMRRAYDGRHGALIYGLLAEDCRFLGGYSSGEKVRAEAAHTARSNGDGGGADTDQQRNGYSQREPQPG